MNKIYKILITRPVEKFIRKQDSQTQKRIINAINKLPEGDVKRLKGYKTLFRLRVGDMRIIIEKHEEEYKIIVIDIDSRGEIYKKY